MTIKLIVGLGNPGREYFFTRHNVGSWFVYLFSKLICAPLRKEEKFIGHVSYGNFSGVIVRLLVPDTFMNSSGNAVAKMASFYHIHPEEILVVHDELDISPGMAKFKFGGGHGGHNGLKDVIKKLGRDKSNFYRLRIGIGHPGDKNKVIAFLLHNPSLLERKMIKAAVDESVLCTKIWFQDGFMKAVNRLHSFRP